MFTLPVLCCQQQIQRYSSILCSSISKKFNDFHQYWSKAGSKFTRKLSPLDFMDQQLSNSSYLWDVKKLVIFWILGKKVQQDVMKLMHLCRSILLHASTNHRKYLSNLSQSKFVFRTELRHANVISCINLTMHLYLIITELFSCYVEGILKVFAWKVLYVKLIDFLETFAVLNISPFV